MSLYDKNEIRNETGSLFLCWNVSFSNVDDERFVGLLILMKSTI